MPWLNTVVRNSISEYYYIVEDNCPPITTESIFLKRFSLDKELLYSKEFSKSVNYIAFVVVFSTVSSQY